MRTLFLAAALSVVIWSCGAQDPEPETITLLAHDSFADGVTEDTFSSFTAETGIEVEVLAAGDAGKIVNQAILTKDNPLADVLFGVDDTFLSRALDAGIFNVYKPRGAADLEPSFVDRRFRVTPVDYGDVCINYDKGWFESTSFVVPVRLDDLRANLYASSLTVEHPATSSPGLAFMLATIAEFGEPGWLDYWADLRDAGVSVAADWTSAYYGEFFRYGGASGMVVSYASSPPAEVIFSAEPLDEAPTGVIEAGCYRQVEYAGVLSGTKHPDAAGRLMDFLISVEFQETIPLTWFVFPANRSAQLPQEFVDHAVIPENPARLSASYIADNRERWIDEWIEVMEG